MPGKLLDSPSKRPESPESGRYALILPPRPAVRVTPETTTRPEMPAVRVPITYVPEPRPEAKPEPEASDAERITQVSEAPAAMATRERFVLLRLDGVEAGSLTALGDIPFQIGRHTSNQLQLDGAGVSRTHARITFQAGAHVIEDLKSANGTFVGGQRVTRVVLRDGDVVQLGPHACFRYTRTDEMHERLLRQLFQSSTRDALTGAYNRRHFDERLTAELAHARRHKGEVSIVLFDIDHFKQVNDTHGHAAGDAVLRHVANLTAGQLRNEDVFARYGGEEFVILLRGIASRDALIVADRVRQFIEGHPATFEGATIKVTVSAGCASLADCGGGGPSVVALADERLYAAKHGGRNRVVGP